MAFDLDLGNADAIASMLVSKAYGTTLDVNEPLKRLRSGEGQFALSEGRKADLVRMEAFLREAAQDVRAILDAQRIPMPEAAE